LQRDLSLLPPLSQYITATTQAVPKRGGFPSQLYKYCAMLAEIMNKQAEIHNVTHGLLD
jgi:hypothetical protein